MNGYKVLTAVILLAVLAGAGVYTWWASRSLEEIHWQKDLSSALKASAAEDKLVLAYLHTDWCKYCRMLESETLPSKDVRRVANRYVWVKMNAETDTDGTRFQQKYSVEGFPTILVLTREGIRVNRIEGFMTPEQFVQTLNAVVKEADSFTSVFCTPAPNPTPLSGPHDKTSRHPSRPPDPRPNMISQGFC